MKKRKKINIAIIIVCGTLVCAVTYLLAMPWWVVIIWLIPGPLTVSIAMIYEKITGKDFNTGKKVVKKL